MNLWVRILGVLREGQNTKYYVFFEFAISTSI